VSALAILKLILSFADSVAKYFHDKQLMDAGAAQEILKGIANVQDQISRAADIRASARKLPNSADPDNIDNDKT